MDALFSTTGDKVAMRSFWGWVKSMNNNILPGWHTLLAMLCYIGLKQGWFKKGGLPLCAQSTAKDLKELLAPAKKSDTGGTCDGENTVKEMR